MVMLARIAAFTPIAINLLLWLLYSLQIPPNRGSRAEDSNLVYFLMAMIPAIVLAANIWLLIMKRGRSRIWAGVFSVPSLLVWMISVVLVAEGFRVH